MLEANLLPVIPGARMTVIEDTGHLLPLEAPGPVANLLSEFTAATGQYSPTVTPRADPG